MLKVLHEGAETDDGDDTLAADRLTRGLHAKAYIVENGWDTTLYLGSANATNASLVAGTNVEILAELTGKRSRVGGIDSFLGDDGLREYLTEFEPPAEAPPLSAEEQAEKIVDAVRSELMLPESGFAVPLPTRMFGIYAYLQTAVSNSSRLSRSVSGPSLCLRSVQLTALLSPRRANPDSAMRDCLHYRLRRVRVDDGPMQPCGLFRAESTC